MIFLKKKPNGYVYTDLYKKNCFDNLRDLEKVSYLEIKKDSSSNESIFYVSESYIEYADSIVISLPYAHVVKEITDDKLSEEVFKLAKEIVNQKSPYNTLKIINTKEFSVGVDINKPKNRGYLMNKNQFNALLIAVNDAEEAEEAE